MSMLLIITSCAHETALREQIWGQGPPAPILCTDESFSWVLGELIALRAAYSVLSNDLTKTQWAIVGSDVVLAAFQGYAFTKINRIGHGLEMVGNGK